MAGAALARYSADRADGALIDILPIQVHEFRDLDNDGTVDVMAQAYRAFLPLFGPSNGAFCFTTEALPFAALRVLRKDHRGRAQRYLGIFR